MKGLLPAHLVSWIDLVFFPFVSYFSQYARWGDWPWFIVLPWLRYLPLMEMSLCFRTIKTCVSRPGLSCVCVEGGTIWEKEKRREEKKKDKETRLEFFSPLFSLAPSFAVHIMRLSLSCFLFALVVVAAVMVPSSRGIPLPSFRSFPSSYFFSLFSSFTKIKRYMIHHSHFLTSVNLSPPPPFIISRPGGGFGPVGPPLRLHIPQRPRQLGEIRFAIAGGQGQHDLRGLDRPAPPGRRSVQAHPLPIPRPRRHWSPRRCLWHYPHQQICWFVPFRSRNIGVVRAVRVVSCV